MPPRSKSDCPTCAPRSATNRSCNRVDPAAVKREETCDEYRKSCEHHCACADPPEDVGTQRAPEPKAEEDDQDPGEVVPNLVVDPRHVRGQRPEIRQSVVRRAVSVRLRERAPDPADTERDKYEKPANPGGTQRHQTTLAQVAEEPMPARTQCGRRRAVIRATRSPQGRSCYDGGMSRSYTSSRASSALSPTPPSTSWPCSLRTFGAPRVALRSWPWSDPA